MRKYLIGLLALIVSMSMLTLTSCTSGGDDNTPSSSQTGSHASQDLSSLEPSSQVSMEPMSQVSAEPSSAISSQMPEESYPDYSYYDDEATSIFTDYLKDQTHSSLSGEERIKDYKITYLEVRNADESGFEFYVEYDILPALPEEFLLAGNGDEGDNGWYVNLGRYVTAQKMGESFIISSISMSPSF